MFSENNETSRTSGFGLSSTPPPSVNPPDPSPFYVPCIERLHLSASFPYSVFQSPRRHSEFHSVYCFFNCSWLINREVSSYGRHARIKSVL